MPKPYSRDLRMRVSRAFSPGPGVVGAPGAPAPVRFAVDDAGAGAQGQARIKAGQVSSALLDRPPAPRDNQRMDPSVRELVLLALLSAFLCVVALIYADPIATAVFAALTSGCVVIAAGLSRGSWT
jgi:hypothetical protein